MGLFDKARKLAEEHADKVEQAIDKVADVVDDKTGGKYADKIDKGAEAAKNALAGDDGGEPAAQPNP
jgi:antitoxin protein of toxin-antitoxin system